MVKASARAAACALLVCTLQIIIFTVGIHQAYGIRTLQTVPTVLDTDAKYEGNVAEEAFKLKLLETLTKIQEVEVLKPKVRQDINMRSYSGAGSSSNAVDYQDVFRLLHSVPSGPNPITNSLHAFEVSDRSPPNP